MKQQQQLEETACYRSFFVYRIVLVCAEQPLSSTFQRKRVFIVAKMLANSFCKCQNCLITPVAISRQFGWIIIATLSLRLEEYSAIFGRETFDSESNKHPSSVHHCCQGLRDERLNFCMRLSFYSREPYVPTWRRTYSDRNSWLFCFKKYTKIITTSQENTSKIMWVYGFEKTILKTASTYICSTI